MAIIFSAVMREEKGDDYSAYQALIVIDMEKGLIKRDVFNKLVLLGI